MTDFPAPPPFARPLLVGYARARKEFREHVLRRTEIPVEYWVSLPVPTTRWAGPGYAGFACPATRRPGEPLRLRAPARWWALGAGQGELLAYARTAAIGFGAVDLGSGEPAVSVTVEPPRESAAAVLEDLDALDQVMEQAVPDFFGGQAGAPELRADLLEMIGPHAPGELGGWYRALAPDFFGWLAGAGGPA
jgi:hypothetical protein